MHTVWYVNVLLGIIQDDSEKGSLKLKSNCQKKETLAFKSVNSFSVTAPTYWWEL